MNTRLFIAITAFAASAETVPAQAPQLISTTTAERWVVEDQIHVAQAVADGPADITVFPDQPLQPVEGFGGTFNELGWDALQALPPAEQDKVIAALFGSDGIHFSFARTPVAASDYALSYYSYDDVKDDYAMRDFSIARDRYILLPYIKKALALRPDLKIWASPWTPPAWMKINEHYTLQAGDLNGRTGGNAMDSRRNVMNNVTAFNMQVGYLQAYALYLSKYVQAYDKEGVRLWALMPQNEIAWSPNWPCCTWRADDLALFIGKYLGPQFEKDGIKTKIWLGTLNYPDPNYPRTVLTNAEAAKFIGGAGFQWSGSKAIGVVQREFPQLPLMQTENMCGNGENNWQSLEESWKSVVLYFNSGVGHYMYWNMVLDETGKSSWGWPQNSLVVIDRGTKTVRFTDEFFLMKHLSHFVQPGSYLLKTEGDAANTLAFRLADKRVAVVIYNPEDRPRKTHLRIGDRNVSFPLKAKSLNTLVLN